MRRLAKYQLLNCRPSITVKVVTIGLVFQKVEQEDGKESQLLRPESTAQPIQVTSVLKKELISVFAV
jgi:hypothetical protein